MLLHYLVKVETPKM